MKGAGAGRGAPTESPAWPRLPVRPPLPPHSQQDATAFVQQPMVRCRPASPRTDWAVPSPAPLYQAAPPAAGPERADGCPRLPQPRPHELRRPLPLGAAVATTTGRLCMAPAVDMTTSSTGIRSDELPASAFSKPSGGLPVTAAMGGEEESDKPKVSPSLLPFSVEALMADHRKPGGREGPEGVGPPGAAIRPSLSPRLSALTAEAPASPLPLGSHFAVGGLVKLPEDTLVKAESPEKQERSPWMQTPRFSPPPPSK